MPPNEDNDICIFLIERSPHDMPSFLYCLYISPLPSFSFSFSFFWPPLHTADPHSRFCHWRSIVQTLSQLFSKYNFHTTGHNLERATTLKGQSKGNDSFIHDKMEVNGRTLNSNEKRPLEKSMPVNMQKKPASDNSPTTSVFVNHAAIAWNESRRKWTGSVSKRSERTTKDPIISWSTRYEDLLSTHEPFSEPIPLPEMVDFLVDIWLDDGLFD